MKALMYFKSTMIQADSEKILCVQKIPSKRFFGRWKISVGTLVEILEKTRKEYRHKSFLMYLPQKITTNCTHTKNCKKYIPQKNYQLYPHKILQKVHNSTNSNKKVKTNT